MSNYDREFLNWVREMNADMDDFSTWMRREAPSPRKTTLAHVLVGLVLAVVVIVEFTVIFG